MNILSEFLFSLMIITVVSGLFGTQSIFRVRDEIQCSFSDKAQNGITILHQYKLFLSIYNSFKTSRSL